MRVRAEVPSFPLSREAQIRMGGPTAASARASGQAGQFAAITNNTASGVKA